MGPVDVCHVSRCSLAGLGPVALEYRSCAPPDGVAGLPRCVQLVGCWLFPVPRPPYVCALSRVLLAPVHRWARVVCCVLSARSWATWLLFTRAPAGCGVLRVQRPAPLGSRSPVCPLVVLCCVCGVLGHLAPVHRCARSVCCFACAVSWVTWLLLTGVPARFVLLCVPCPGPYGSCSQVCPLGVLCCVCGVLGPLAPLHLCTRWVCCVACAVSWATWLLSTGLPARFVVLCVRCPGPLGSCSPVCPLGVLCCVCGAMGPLAPDHRCARRVCCVACAVSSATWLLFTGVPDLSLVLFVRCPGPLGFCSPVCPLGVLLCVCGVLGLLAPVDRCARPWCPLPLLSSVHAHVRFPGLCGASSPVCALCAVRVCRWWLCPSSSPPKFRSFLKWKKRGAHTLQAQARAAGAAVQ